MAFAFGPFISSTLVVWRESFEAFLIVGILLGLLDKIDANQYRSRVWWGTIAGVAASVLLGWGLLRLAEDLREQYEVAFEATASLLAVAVLTYMIVWMYRHTVTLMGGMHQKVRMALEAGTLGVLFLMPFLAVVREGFETVLFLAAGSDAEGLTLVAGLVTGLALAVALGWLLFSGAVRLSVERFFALTGMLLVLFASWMLRYGLHELGELVEEVAHEPGEWLEGPIAWAAGALYLLGMSLWYLRPIWKRRRLAAVSAGQRPDD